MVKQPHPPGPPMDLANMFAQGIRHLIAYCHNDACRHQGSIDVSSYPPDLIAGEVRQVWPRRQMGGRAPKLD